MAKRIAELRKKVDRKKVYDLAEGVAFLLTLATAKFDESVEVHARVSIDPKKGDQQIRSTVSLPHGTGKVTRVAVFVAGEAQAAAAKEAGADIVGGQELIDEIKKSEKTDFDVAVATPDMMPKMGPIAKTLGTRGLMPNPKNDTVTTDVKRIVSELKKGKVTFKNDDTSNIHLAIGKVSFGAEKIAENLRIFLEALLKAKPRTSKGTYIKTLTLTTTMGPAVRIAPVV